MSTTTPRVLSDLSIARPREALTAASSPRRGCWRVVDYRTEEGLEGRMLFAAPEDEAPPLQIPLGAAGLHRIFLGINYTRAGLGDRSHFRELGLYGNLEARLSGDSGYARFACECPWRQDTSNKTGGESRIWHAIHETYWRTADLSGKDLFIAPPLAPYNAEHWSGIANLAYVRLVPLSLAEQRAWDRLADHGATRNLALAYCTGEFSGHTHGVPMYHPTDPQRMRDVLSPYLDNDVGILCFEAIRGNLCLFRTATGDVGTADNSWPADWIDPLDTVVGIAHEHGVRVFAGMRMVGASLPVVRHPIQWARFYWRHREWAKRAPDGSPASNLSLAFPEVRAYWLALLREALDDHGCDGVHLLLDRCWPFVLYEEPSRALFQANYGEDPRRVDAADPRWVQHQCDVVTLFLREVRGLLDEVPGRSLAVHVLAAAYGTWEAREPKQFGCDVDAWLREGLVDYVMPTPCGHCESAAGPETFFARWKQAGPAVRLYPDLFTRTQMAAYYAKLARKLYAAGADGLSMRDGERRSPRASEWAVCRHLGHREMLDLLEREAPDYFRSVRLQTLNGMAVPYSYNDG